MENYVGRECTPKCHSLCHAAQILSCVSKGLPSEIRAYCLWLCCNFAAVTDEWGRNILHLAASCGKREIVEWLLEHCRCEVDVRDSESGWTALHRSFYYGQLSVARVLLSHGASLQLTDHDGLTPLDLITKDRLPYIEYYLNYPSEVFVWGSNSNYNLGLDNPQGRGYPEILEFFRRDNISIKQVVICKFHSVFLSADGRVFTCGHGFGGRLGQNSEETSLTPLSVRGLGSVKCEQVASGQDHLVLLMEGGQVWTCGLNTYHQLGHSPPPERLLVPKPISLKFLKGKVVIGICAARYHSVFYTKDSVFTFGLNAGQLGHPKGSRTQIIPHQVSGLYNEKWKITHVAASDGATVCATTAGDVYVLHEYQQRRIASKQLEIKKLCVIGGNLDSRCEAAGVRDGGALELRVLLLTKSGKLFLWRQSNPFLRRCLFTCTRQLIISDIYLNHYSVQMLTHENEGYSGVIVERKVRAVSSPSVKQQGHLNVLLDREDCDFIKVKKIPHIYRGVAITSDSKGRNFAVLQTDPKMGLLESPVFPASNMVKDMTRLWEEIRLENNLHDIILKVGQKEYFAHKYILASRSEYFKKHLAVINSTDKTEIKLDNIREEAVEQVLKFLYCNTCDFLVNDFEIKWSKMSPKDQNVIEDENNVSALVKSKQQKKKSSKKCNEKSSGNPLQCVQEASRRLGVSELNKLLDRVTLVNRKVKSEFIKISRLMFDRLSLLSLSDVTLCSNDGKKFLCHKCILISRSEYFHSMLGFNWIETTHLDSLSLPIHSDVMEILLLYLYNDVVDCALECKDAEFVCQVLVVADQLLISHLKEVCEGILVSLLTLKNATELLQLAYVYNAIQLKKACMEYICINLCAIIEAKTLDILSNEVIDELSMAYRALIPSMRKRIIIPSASIPSKRELEDVEKYFPISEDSDLPKQIVEMPNVKNQEVKNKSKRKSLGHRSETKVLTKSIQNTSQESINEIVLNVSVASADEEFKKESESKKMPSPDNILNKNSSVFDIPLTQKKPGQWVMSPPPTDKMPCLDEIMLEEKREMILLQKPSNVHEAKRVFHLTQKQKKQIAAASKETKSQNIISVGSPPPSSNHMRSPPPCPWAKPLAQSPVSESFWDSLAKGELQSSAINLSCSPPGSSAMSLPSSPSSPDGFMSLQAIQQAEEEEMHKAACKPKVKPLHLINVEDQAIEELLVLYKASENPYERITVSRILPETTAKPTWKKHLSFHC